MATETIRIGADSMVRATQIIGTDITVYSVWERSAYILAPVNEHMTVGRHDHSTITHIDGVLYGRLGTRRCPPELDKLPAYSDERFDAVTAFQQAQYQEAYDIILAHYPITGLTVIRMDMGEIEARG
jgi:calcineurin-like phosphoesterase family protein